ncbi:hypothetical protein XENOCAPTIV_005170, partial [Xenoophorus captivus]
LFTIGNILLLFNFCHACSLLLVATGFPSLKSLISSEELSLCILLTICFSVMLWSAAVKPPPFPAVPCSFLAVDRSSSCQSWYISDSGFEDAVVKAVPQKADIRNSKGSSSGGVVGLVGHCLAAFSYTVPEIQYFGASALHTKISRYWSDIPTDQYESLKSQLFSQIACFSSGSKMVLTRLCVALASLALNTMPDAWPGAVAEMVRVFQEEGGGVDGRARCLALLELLTVLPEEFQTSRLPQYRKGQVMYGGLWGESGGRSVPYCNNCFDEQTAPGRLKPACCAACHHGCCWMCPSTRVKA